MRHAFVPPERETEREADRQEASERESTGKSERGVLEREGSTVARKNERREIQIERMRETEPEREQEDVCVREK